MTPLNATVVRSAQNRENKEIHNVTTETSDICSINNIVQKYRTSF